MINNIKLVLSKMMNIRQAKIADLPAIHNLIRHSYMAMLEHTGEEMRERWAKGAEERYYYYYYYYYLQSSLCMNINYYYPVSMAI